MPARRKENPGWQTLQREWYGPRYRPLPRHNLHVAGDMVGDVLKNLGLADTARLSQLEKNWPDLVGAANAARSRPGHWERGVLTVHVDHHLWLNEMKRVVAAPLLKRLQNHYGRSQIRRIRFEITPEDQ